MPALEAALVDTQLSSECLELAALISRASETILRVIRDHQLIKRFAHTAYGRRISVDDHALTHSAQAGSLQVFHTLHFHNANTAGSEFMYIFQITEIRDMYVILPRCLQDGRTFCCGHCLSVNCKMIIFSLRRSAGSALLLPWHEFMVADGHFIKCRLSLVQRYCSISNLLCAVTSRVDDLRNVDLSALLSSPLPRDTGRWMPRLSCRRRSRGWPHPTRG